MQPQCQAHHGSPPHYHCPFCRGAVSARTAALARAAYADHAWHCVGAMEVWR